MSKGNAKKRKEENFIIEEMLNRKKEHISEVKEIISYITENADIISNLVVSFDIESISSEEETHTYWAGNKNACIGLTDGLMDDIKEEVYYVRSSDFTDEDDIDD